MSGEIMCANCDQLVIENNALRAEVERLRKVALHLYEFYEFATTYDSNLINPTCEGCIEAKEVLGGDAARKGQA